MEKENDQIGRVHALRRIERLFSDAFIVEVRRLNPAVGGGDGNG